MRRSWPILWRWLAQVVVLVVPVLALVAWTVSERRDEFMADAQLRASIFAESYARELGLLIADSEDVLGALQRLPALETIFEQGCPGDEAPPLPHSLRRYGNLLLVDAAGRIVCAAVPGSDQMRDFADREWFSETVAGTGLNVSSPIVGRLTGRPIVVLSTPVADPGGGPPRVVLLTLDLLTLSESLQRVFLPHDTVVTIVDRERRVVARSIAPERWIGRRVLLDGYPDEVSPDEVEDRPGLDGLRRLFAAAALDGAPWTVFVGLPVEGVLVSMQPYLVRTALLAGTTATFLFILAIWMSVGVGNPVRRLAAAVRDIQRHGGRLGRRVRGPREIEDVAIEFDRLLESQADTLREAERSEQRYRATFEQAPVGIVHQDEAGRYQHVNRRFAEMVGRDPGELLGQHDHALTHPEDRAQSGAAYRRLATGDETLGSLRKRYLRPDGTEVWTDVVVSRVGGNGEEPLFISVIEDITRARQAEERRALAATVFENSAEGIVISGAGRNIRAVNRAFTELTGFTERDILGQPIRVLRSDQHSPEFYDELWREVAQHGEWRGELWMPRKAGGPFPTLLGVTAVKDSAGIVTGYVSVFADLSREKEREAKLDYLVHHDPLTQLPNRRLLNARLEHTIQQAFRDPGQHFSLLFIDLDDFKVVNDSLGHDAGDQLLVEFSRRLSASVRAEDTVARMGGDEFMVLLEGAGTFNEISAPVSKILEAAHAPFVLSGQEVFVAASIGVAIFPLDADDAASLVRNADVAMYRAKDKGKNRFEFYEAAMSDQAMERLSLANDLRRALDGGQFYLVYQPKVAAADGRIVGFEALLRWRHPERGEIGAERFIRVAEETGVMVPIGLWVLGEATRQMADWRARGLTGVSMAVNLSAQEIAHPRILERIRATLAASGLPGEALEIELTESALIRDPERVAPLLRAIRALGVRIAIDDFGTGYSSLNYLRQFRLDALKIDRSFVMELERSRRARIIPQAVVALGQALHLSTIAEGVENEAQVDILRNMGCEQLQGYGIGRPLASKETEAMLRARGLMPVVEGPA
jgi:diguanylate cyclase (GGDEF)-like protein/PAS domain S-box-containing protein